MSEDKWIDDIAETIRSNWLEWESDAAMISTVDQDSRSGEHRLHRLLVDAIEKALRKRTGGSAPVKVHQHGHLGIGMTGDGFVALQFHDPEWWLHLTPAEARNVAKILNSKASEVENTVSLIEQLSGR